MSCHAIKEDSIRDSPSSSHPMGNHATWPLALHRPILASLHLLTLESLAYVDTILALKRVATAALKLCHPFLTIAVPGGGWTCPVFCHQCPPTALNCSMEVGDLLQTASCRPQGHQSPSDLYRRDLRLT